MANSRCVLKRHRKPAAQVAPPGGEGSIGQNQGLQTHTRRAIKNLKWKRVNDPKKVFNWKRRQQQKLKKTTEVLDASEFVRKMFLKKHRFKKRQINALEQVTNKVMNKPIRTTYILETEEFCIFCLEKRQQSSSVVMSARLRSNRRCKPADVGRDTCKKLKVIRGTLEQ